MRRVGVVEHVSPVAPVAGIGETMSNDDYDNAQIDRLIIRVPAV
jgi:hypothetical protein